MNTIKYKAIFLAASFVLSMSLLSMPVYAANDATDCMNTTESWAAAIGGNNVVKLCPNGVLRTTVPAGRSQSQVFVSWSAQAGTMPSVGNIIVFAPFQQGVVLTPSSPIYFSTTLNADQGSYYGSFNISTGSNASYFSITNKSSVAISVTVSATN